MKLINGDCLELMKDIPSNSIDMVLTDPPYGINYHPTQRVNAKQFKKIINDDSLTWLSEFYKESFRVLKNDTSIYCFCSWHNVDVFKKGIEERFKLKNILVWVKNNHGGGDLKASYGPKHEFILYGHKGRSLFRCKRIPDVLNYPKIPSLKTVHPTEKNIDMLSIFIENNTDQGGVVLDPFMGSGSTGVACKDLGREFIGMELDKNYYDIAVKRINETPIS